MTAHTARIEPDFLVQLEIPADACWAVHSARAIDNFPLSGQAVAQVPELVRALAFVRKAAAQANAELGVLDAAPAAAPRLRAHHAEPRDHEPRGNECAALPERLTQPARLVA